MHRSYKLGSALARLLFAKIGEETSAPVNFMASGDYHKMRINAESPEQFASGYYEGWWRRYDEKYPTGNPCKPR
jgi:hypothetical protein